MEIFSKEKIKKSNSIRKDILNLLKKTNGVGFSKNLKKKIVIITGSTSGIGLEVAISLAKMKAKVIFAVRNEKKFQKIKKERKLKDNCIFMKLDLCSLKSVENFVEEFNIKFEELNFLVNNGGIASSQSVVKYGNSLEIEKIFHVNYLSHYYLTKLLMPKLKKEKNFRIINISSVTHADCIKSDFNSYSIPFDSKKDSKEKLVKNFYGKSKFAQVIHSKLLLEESLKNNKNFKGIICSIDIGAVFTNIWKSLPILFQKYLKSRISSPKEASQLVLNLLLNDNLKSENYFYEGFKPQHPKNKLIDNDQFCMKVWNDSEELIQRYKGIDKN